jgi:cytochrome o ubiquinol oxidase operon protein cyoD
MKKTILNQKQHAKKLLMLYSIGFGTSLLLTIAAFAFVSMNISDSSLVLTDNFILSSLFILAIIQLFVQIICFLHLGNEPKPKWNTIALYFAIFVVIVLVAGSIWIMYNLDYNMMPANDMDRMIMNDEEIHR